MAGELLGEDTLLREIREAERRLLVINYFPSRKAGRREVQMRRRLALMLEERNLRAIDCSGHGK